MIDIKQFRKRNKLKQEELAEYLGVTRAFISMVETGSSKLPTEKLNLLVSNPHGWDTSMLINGSIYAGNNNVGDVNVQIGQNRASGDAHAPGDSSTSMKIAVLEKENEMLREQIEFMKTLIKMKE